MKTQTTNNMQSSPLGRWMEVASLVTAGAALLVTSVFLVGVQFVSLRQSVLDDVDVQARILGETSAAAVVFNDSKDARETLGALKSSPNIVAAGIFTMDGKMLAAFRQDDALHVAPPTPELISQGYCFSFNRLDLVQRIVVDGHAVGYVVMRARLNQLYARLAGYAGLTLVIAMGSLGIGYLVVARMRRRVRTAEAHLDYLAHVDPVTGLPNRHAFNSKLSQAIAKVDQFGGNAGLLLLDLDNFKIVNDTLGHHSGDMLLKLAAARLLECLRSDDVICRIGGDEFAIIYDSLNGRSGEAIAEKILAALDAPFEIDGHEIYVTASIGISSYPADAKNLETLTRNADAAMYQAKNKGKNAYEAFHPELDRRVRKRLSMETSLRKALERDELTLYYQPQVNMHDGRIVGLEALLRWNHPELGLVGPDEFIPIAEDCGLIVPIGRWVLRKACTQMALWREAGLGAVRVSVNLSGRQTRDTRLLQDILGALRNSGVTPEQLELEITETVLMDKVHANVDLLHRLRTEGIRLAIDDFGTGYSSMAYLKRFPINQVKIDRTFVRDIPGDGDDEAITTAIIAMAHGLGLTVVAEGVETAQQLDFLRKAGCDIMQGYYFAEPRPAEQIAVLLSSHSCPVSQPASPATSITAEAAH